MIREVNALEEELKERQGEFIKRERVYRMRLDELNRELEALRKTKTEWMDQDESLTQLRGVHGEIQKNVGLIQQHAAQLVHDQEQEMLASFRSRLVDVQAELDAERAKKYDGATAWIERARQLEVDVDGERDRADALDRTNQALGAEHGRLRQSFEMQEDDRAFLLRQLAGVRADNVKAREDIGRRQAQVAALDSGAPPQDLPPVRAPEQRDESSDAAYRDMIRKLNRLLDLERKHISQVKTAHDDWAALRTP
mmetsp:Transcript_28678/g.98690  ORF Transcript_28678/g.98690 Transcript_28678/m.98690 type:complete len:253 (+) Transcript_28678:67-825(+)